MRGRAVRVEPRLREKLGFFEHIGRKRIDRPPKFPHFVVEMGAFGVSRGADASDQIALFDLRAGNNFEFSHVSRNRPEWARAL